ncbi:MAG: hypothetical protein LLF28_03090 [Nitrospiraceae bacterium]|nr:hypothetical protein [Nitrospiraceae bacterium]
MSKILSFLAAAAILIIFLTPGLGICEDEQKIVPATKSQPLTKSKQTPATKALKKDSKVDAKMLSTGVGKREVFNADFKIEGITGNTSGIKDNNDKIRTGEKDSVIIINGWMELGDMQYNSAFPLFQMPHIIFADAPKTCRITNSWFPQPKQYVMRYRYRFTFEDTATKSECWSYFMKLDKLRMKVEKINVKINSPWEKGQEMNIVGAGMMEFALSPVKKKNPNGD